MREERKEGREKVKMLGGQVRKGESSEKKRQTGDRRVGETDRRIKIQPFGMGYASEQHA